MPARPFASKALPWPGDPFETYLRFKTNSPAVLLESAREGGTGRWSIAANDPFLTLEYARGRTMLRSGSKVQTSRRDPFAVLKNLLKEHAFEGPPGLPPFATGAIGYAGYECQTLVEPRAGLKTAKPREFPDLYFLFFDRCAVWDHMKREVVLCARGGEAELLRFEKEWRSCLGRRVPRAKKASGAMTLESSFDEESFARAVERAKRYIREGEIFQANLAQRFSFPLQEKPEAVYAALRRINPSPFFGVLDAGEFQIVSGSPERLLKLEGASLETRPIAGTRRRGADAREDARLGAELLLSEKERAEHVMLVDLERNDLGRVAEYGSVAVDELMALEDYSHVKHIVSNVRGTLRRGLDAVDAFKAFFPGGTITGAPNIRCMQVIEELEPVARGPYTGSLGYFSFTGNMDFNILIRSLVIRDKKAALHVGAGIVADSEPRREYHETLYKAEAVLSAVFGASRARSFLRKRGAHARLS